MGTQEDAEVPTTHAEEPGLGLSSSEEVALIDKFQNVGLHSHYSGGPDGFSAAPLPLRPYAGDCPHYLKTGMCKFGPHCKFNHPVKRTGSVVKDKDRDLEKAGRRVECKYYLTTGGCKYGKFCRYSHSKDGSDNANPLLNFLGLPIRVGEKECPYYMRNGSCGYGAHCVFHHPEPSSIGEVNDKSLGQSGNTLGSLDCESALLQLSEASKPHQAPWSSHPLSESTFSYQDGQSHHIITNSFLQEAHRHSEQNQYQAPEFPFQRSSHTHLTPGANGADMLQPIIATKVEEFPERPGQPDCVYFLKTGHCKFKSACRFHHPKGQLQCLLSENGLPLRPGRSICRHYERSGVCKFGRECLFDHPVYHNLSKFQDRSSSKPASGRDGGSWSE